ncbi:MAG TPA: hypothetical protein QF571_01455 [Desulfobacterales bacterium]|nr:hypothetical protein [Desulfobacterales bacterium]
MAPVRARPALGAELGVPCVVDAGQAIRRVHDGAAADPVRLLRIDDLGCQRIRDGLTLERAVQEVLEHGNALSKNAPSEEVKGVHQRQC